MSTNTKTTLSRARFWSLIIISILTIPLSAQLSTLTHQGLQIDESIITIKNKKLVFEGLSPKQIDQGYSIVSIINDGNEGVAKVLNGVNIEYNPTYNTCNRKDELSYLITNGGREKVKEVSVEILCESLAVMSSLSPNEDGEQSKFVILGADRFPDNELVIFNDLGLEIYRKNNYSNNWNGKFQGRTLPLGVYYYVFRTGTEEVLSGYLYMRDKI